MNSLRRFTARAAVAVLLTQSAVWAAWPQAEWQAKAFQDLCTRYLGDAPPADAEASLAAEWLDRLTMAVGKRLAEQGSAGAPAEDVALLALLQAGLRRPPEPAVEPAPAPAEPAAPQEPAPGQRQAVPISHITKGEEGIRQAQERLDALPITERMVITGDVVSAVQAATVSDGTDLTTTVGRARVNFVLRAMAGSPRRGLGDGYFLVQMRAAGGAPDSSAVGGPAAFTPLNNIAADRSTFNEPTSRGNLYLSKVYYQQRLQLGEDHIEGRVGVVELSDYFDTNLFANNEARQFVNAAFVNGAAFKSGIIAPGLMGEYHRRMRRDWLQALVLRAGYAISRTERAFTSPLWTTEVELQTLLGDREGSWRFGGTFGNIAGEGSYRGLHVSVDQWLTNRTGLFGRFALANAGPGSQAFGPVRSSWSGGFQMRTGEDRNSAFSAGFSQSFPIRTEGDPASERVFEAYYRMQVTPMISVTPDFQLILGSGGRTRRGTHTVYGIRLNFGY